jgi:hypothetical protein
MLFLVSCGFCNSTDAICCGICCGIVCGMCNGIFNAIFGYGMLLYAGVVVVFGCLLFAEAVVLLRMLCAVGYVVEYMVEYCVEYVVGYFASRWLLFGDVMVAVCFLCGCFPVAVALLLPRKLFDVAHIVECVLECTVEYVAGYLASCWLLSGCFMVAIYLVSAYLLVVCSLLWILCSEKGFCCGTLNVICCGIRLVYHRPCHGLRRQRPCLQPHTHTHTHPRTRARTRTRTLTRTRTRTRPRTHTHTHTHTHTLSQAQTHRRTSQCTPCQCDATFNV